MIRARRRQQADYEDYFAYLESDSRPRVVVELRPEVLNEAKTATVGRFTARRDQPHFVGDQYHGHCDVGGGKEVSWNLSGVRRHQNKFPAAVPNDAKAAVAQVLGLSQDILEAFWIEEDGKRVLLLEARYLG